MRGSGDRDIGFWSAAAVAAIWVAALGLMLARPAAAQTENLPADFRMSAITGVAVFTCRFRDNTITPTVLQGQEIELVVSVETPTTGTRYRLVNVVQSFPEPPASVHLVASRPFDERVNDSFQHVQEYLATLKVDAGALPRSYDLQLTFEAEGRRPEQRTIRLFVGALQTGGYVGATVGRGIPLVSSGETSSLPLEIQNKFPTYRLTLTNVEISSTPAGLIDTFKWKGEVHIAAGESRGLDDVILKGKRPLWRQLFPIESQPKLNVSLVFNDGYRSDIKLVPPIEFEFVMEVDPAVTVALAIASIVIGSLAGAWLRMRFSSTPDKERRVSRSERVIASLVLSAAVVGLLVLARIEVLSDSSGLRLALHSPTATALISFLIALYNPTELVDYLRRRFQPGAAAPAAAAKGAAGKDHS